MRSFQSEHEKPTYLCVCVVMCYVQHKYINFIVCIQQVKREVGDVTILINNAGIVTGKKFLESPDTLIEKTVEVNSMAHFWVSTQKCLFNFMVCFNKQYGLFTASVKQNKQNHFIQLRN